MKKIFLTIATLLFTLYSVSQKTNKLNLINLNTKWGKEVFEFPISFAPNIHYQGHVEVRFPPEGWRKPTHQNFWSYTYAWYVNSNKKITAEKLVKNLEKYFDGLNNVNPDNKKDNRKTLASISEISNTNNTTSFKGYVDIFDRFATNKRITLNTIIKNTYCKKNTIILFKFSPKPFSHKTWKVLQQIDLTDNLCNE